jgi:hypothetical protein
LPAGSDERAAKFALLEQALIHMEAKSVRARASGCSGGSAPACAVATFEPGRALGLVIVAWCYRLVKKKIAFSSWPSVVSFTVTTVPELVDLVCWYLS